MDALLTSAASGMKARMESLDMLANNLANVATTGFKLDRESFSLYVSPEAEASASEFPISQSPIIERHRTDLTQGSMLETGNPLNVALSGPGFLTVTMPDGLGYTRNGQLRIGKTGALETTDGYVVRNKLGKPIVVDPLLPVDIDRAGIVSQASQELGQIELTAVSSSDQLGKLGSTYFSLATGATTQSTEAEVRQGYLEGSNVNPGESAVRLVSVMRQFEMMQRAIQLGADMNRKVLDEVAKVS